MKNILKFTSIMMLLMYVLMGIGGLSLSGCKKDAIELSPVKKDIPIEDTIKKGIVNVVVNQCWRIDWPKYEMEYPAVISFSNGTGSLAYTFTTNTAGFGTFTLNVLDRNIYYSCKALGYVTVSKGFKYERYSAKNYVLISSDAVRSLTFTLVK